MFDKTVKSKKRTFDMVFLSLKKENARYIFSGSFFYLPIGVYRTDGFRMLKKGSSDYNVKLVALFKMCYGLYRKLTKNVGQDPWTPTVGGVQTQKFKKENH